MNQPLIISRAHLTVKPSATCRTKAFPYSSFAPENPLLFRDSPFNEQILFLFIILLFSSFSIHDNQLSNTLIVLYFLFFIFLFISNEKCDALLHSLLQLFYLCSTSFKIDPIF